MNLIICRVCGSAKGVEEIIRYGWNIKNRLVPTEKGHRVICLHCLRDLQDNFDVPPPKDHSKE